MFVIIILALIAFSQLALSLLILFQSRRSNLLEHKLFVGLSTITFFWILANIILAYVDSHGTVSNLIYFDIANRAGFTLGTLTLLSIYVFNLFYPVRKPFKIFPKIIVGIGLATLALAPTNLVSGTFAIEDKVVYTPGLASAAIAIFALLVLIGVFTQNIRFIKHATDQLARKQARTLLAGLALMIFHGIFFIIVLPMLLGDNVTFYIIGYCAPYFFTGFTIYGLIKQSLFDIRLIVARSVAYVLLLVTLGALYGVSIFTVSTVLFSNAVVGGGEQLIYIALAVFLAFTFQPLRRFFEKFTDQILYRDRYDTQAVLNRLGEVLTTQLDINPIINRSLFIICEAIKPLHGKLIVLDEGKIYRQTAYGDYDVSVDPNTLSQLHHGVIAAKELGVGKMRDVLQQYDASAFLRLRTKEGVVGYILLGPKQSGNIYTHQDIKLLELVGNELAVALQNARSYEKIAEFNITLQQRIEEATVRLRVQNKKLKELDEAKDEFISMASHQLRTPLTTIKGYLSMLLEGDAGKVPAKQQGFLDLAFTSSDRMVSLINDMLSVSRINTGKFVIEKANFDLAQMVAEEVEQLNRYAVAKNVKLVYQKPDPIMVCLDEGKLRQVVMNFIDNAIYYAPNGQVKVELVHTPTAVEFRVIDNGIGVPKEAQKHLFTKFYRAGNAQKVRPDGTGLGLYMAKMVVETQEGTILFTSTEGKGSTFGFHFPFKKIEPIAEPTPPTKKAVAKARTK